MIFFRLASIGTLRPDLKNTSEMKQALRKLSVKAELAERQLTPESSVAQQRALRSDPVNQCGKRALKTFNLTKLQRPANYLSNNFIRRDATVFDMATNLTWQYSGSPFPQTWQNGLDYIASLNEIRFGGINCWRLPSIDELLSLLNEKTTRPDPSFFQPEKKWLWSCDLHGKMERWFINLDMGYAAAQDIDCLNYIRAVSSGTF